MVTAQMDSKAIKQGLNLVTQPLDISTVNRSEVARNTHLSPEFVSRVFSGQRCPSLRNARKIADALYCTLDSLYDALEMVWAELEAETILKPFVNSD